MHTHDSPGFQPTAHAPQTQPLAPRSFEVTYPGQEIASSSTNPFPHRPHEVWMGESPVKPEAPAEPEARSESSWLQFSLYAGGQDPPTPPKHNRIQAKLTIGQPNDVYEQEADRVAEQVMSMAPPTTSNIQRQTEGDEELQTKPLAETITPIVQRQELAENEEPLQAKCAACEGEEQVQRSSDTPTQAQPNLESRLNASKGSGSALPNEVRSFMEPRFGADFSGVRVHTSSEAIQMNQELNAQAFTHGQDVYFGSGKTPGNDALTAHELTHVVQQTGKTQLEVIERSKLECSDKSAFSTSIVQLKHQSIPDVVANFKAVVTPTNEASGSPTLAATGQFYWTNQIAFAILQYLKTLKTLNANNVWQSLIIWVENVVNQWPHNQATYWSGEIKKYLATIRKLASLPDNAAVIPLLKYIEVLLKMPTQQGKAIYYELWGQLNKTDQVPNLDKYRSMPTLQAIWEWENVACGFTGNQVANRFTRKGGAKKINPDAKRKKSTQVWAKFSTSGSRDMRPRADGFRLGDVLIQNGVSSAIPKMQAALDDGWILHARVLSGIEYGEGNTAARNFDVLNAKGTAPKQPQGRDSPPEEHSIMIIGYDLNEFVFWDPDSFNSNRRGPGFGSLFFSNGNLSTAENTADLVVNLEGNHRRSQRDHRYQIIHLGSQ